MLYIFQQLLNALFPKTEAVQLLDNISEDEVISLFTPGQIDHFHFLASYHHPIIQAAITANKFHKYERAAKLISPLLVKWIENLPIKDAVFIPIPLSTKRELSRGYNQVLRILQFTNDQRRININNHLLKRVLDTTPQTSLHRSERLTNLKGAFKANIPDHFPFKRVVIVDDVATTGATLKAAKEALADKLKPDCEIICVAIAH